MQNWSIRRLNWARDLIGAERYLEIGVYLGGTFLGFDCAQKDGIDPEFLFDTAKHESPHTRFFSQTSDAFFVDPQRSGEPPYDLVFIDGLHTYEQTLRDFLNVLTRTHDRSLILIDDTFPSDIYSAETNRDRTDTHRARAGGKGTAWHGDIYKLVFFIHDFMPTLSFATIRGSGNPQTLIWRQRRRAFKPLFNNTETISRLSYFDMFDHRNAMKNITEDKAQKLVARAFAQGRGGTAQ